MLSSNLKKVLSWLAHLIVLVGLFVVVNSYQTRNMLQSGDSLSPYKLPVLNKSETYSLSPTGETQRYLFYFFAPWCNVCEHSIRSLNSLTDDNLQVVAIALDFASSNEVQEFIADKELSIPVLLGNEDIQRHYKVVGYPSYYLLDANFKVLHKDLGFNTNVGLWLTTKLH